MKLNRLNILQNFKIENYFDYPYPFFEIENALPEEVYTALKNDYPIFNKYFRKTKTLIVIIKEFKLIVKQY